MPDTEAGRLNSWKQIARHLGRDVRTAMRWEKQGGMPVHRVPGPGDGRSVFAYVSELDAWLAGHDEAEPAPPPSIRRRMNRWGWAITLVMLGFVAVLLSPRGLNQAGFPGGDIARVTAEGTMLTAQTVDGTTLWSIRHPEGRTFQQPGLTVRMPGTEGTAHQGVFVAANTSGSGGHDQPYGELLALSGSGEILWRQSVDDVLDFGERSFSGPWMSAFLYSVEIDGSEALLWGLHHTTWWPSMVLVLAPDGSRRGRFVNSGWVSAAVVVPSPRGDVLLVSGVSNARGAAMLAAMPAALGSVASPEDPGAPFECLNCAATTPMRYFLFPPTEVNRANGLPYNRSVVGLSHEGATVTVLEGPLGSDAQWVYEFTHDLTLFHVAPGDSYWAAHDLLEQEGRIDHAAGACPESPGIPIRGWSPQEGWTTLSPGGEAPGS